MYYQQLQMLKNGTRACTDRIVRIFQSHVHPIVRGKPKSRPSSELRLVPVS